jgi:hypothetical protein
MRKRAILISNKIGLNTYIKTENKISHQDYKKNNDEREDTAKLTVESASTGVLLVLAVVLPHGVNSKSDLIPVTHSRAAQQSLAGTRVNVCVCNYWDADEIIILGCTLEIIAPLHAPHRHERKIFKRAL